VILFNSFFALELFELMQTHRCLENRELEVEHTNDMYYYTNFYLDITISPFLSLLFYSLYFVPCSCFLIVYFLFIHSMVQLTKLVQLKLCSSVV
jgi:hypothetical protein